MVHTIALEGLQGDGLAPQAQLLPLAQLTCKPKALNIIRRADMHLRSLQVCQHNMLTMTEVSRVVT